MKRLLSVLFAAALTVAFVVAGPAAGAGEKFIYQADLIEPPLSSTPVNISYARVTVDTEFNVEVKVKTDQTDSRLGVSMVEGMAPYRHGVYLGDVYTDAEGSGRALFNLKNANIDYQIPGAAVIEPSFRLFSFKDETGVDPAMEASTAFPVYSTPPAPSDKGTISLRRVLPDGYNGEVPVFDLSWTPYPFYGAPIDFTNLVPRYYAITRMDLATGLAFDKVIIDDPNADSFVLGQGPAGPSDRTLIVNLGPGQTVNVTYYYKYK